MRRRKKHRINIGPAVGRIMWALLFATALILLTPTPERDTGPPPKIEIKDDFLATPTKYDRFRNYLRNHGFAITRDQLPLLIEVSKRQVEGNPSEIAEKLSQKGYQITDEKIKVILHTFGGKYIAEYNPE
ncbi:hypothetical protein J7M00_09930 [bacterium]|nr:hypothetical protein [bacterium]